MNRVEGHSHLLKDKQTGAIINSDLDALASARAAKRKIMEDKAKIADLESRLDRLEDLFKTLAENKQ